MPSRGTTRFLYLLQLVRGDWLPGTWSAEACRFVPSLLLGVYVAHLEGVRLTKREGAALMNADPASSGPKYIALAEEAGLISIERRPDIDRRKDFLSATPTLVEFFEKEQKKLEKLFSKADVASFSSDPLQNNEFGRIDLNLSPAFRPLYRMK
jgi:hypothetical protein